MPNPVPITDARVDGSGPENIEIVNVSTFYGKPGYALAQGR